MEHFLPRLRAKQDLFCSHGQRPPADRTSVRNILAPAFARGYTGLHGGGGTTPITKPTPGVNHLDESVAPYVRTAGAARGRGMIFPWVHHSGIQDVSEEASPAADLIAEHRRNR
jgi:hypothetical protein